MATEKQHGDYGKGPQKGRKERGLPIYVGAVGSKYRCGWTASTKPNEVQCSQEKTLLQLNSNKRITKLREVVGKLHCWKNTVKSHHSGR